MVTMGRTIPRRHEGTTSADDDAEVPISRRAMTSRRLRGALAILAFGATACGTATQATDQSGLVEGHQLARSHTPLSLFTPQPSASPTLAAPAAPPPASTAVPPATLPPDPITVFHPGGGSNLGGCAVFPSNNPWNQDVSSLPLDPNSNTYITRIDTFRQFVHPDFGSDPSYGIPYVVVPGSQPFVPITFNAYGNESDPGPYPVPLNAPVEAGSDRHVLVADSGNCHLYEMFGAQQQGSGWTCASGAVFDLSSNALRPDTWTSADAAGLPILPGLVRYDEVASGVINHALRFTVDESQNGFIHPATHQAGVNNPADPPMGLRLRLKASLDLSPFHGESLVILTALKKYGMLLADNGSSWYISGSTDTRWNDNDLNQLKTVPGSAFEAVQTGSIQRG
jgi:hypothetical protein